MCRSRSRQSPLICVGSRYQRRHGRTLLSPAQTRISFLRAHCHRQISTWRIEIIAVIDRLQPDRPRLGVPTTTAPRQPDPGSGREPDARRSPKWLGLPAHTARPPPPHPPRSRAWSESRSCIGPLTRGRAGRPRCRWPARHPRGRRAGGRYRPSRDVPRGRLNLPHERVSATAPCRHGPQTARASSTCRGSSCQISPVNRTVAGRRRWGSAHRAFDATHRRTLISKPDRMTE
jgi:hypothetical protein